MDGGDRRTQLMGDGGDEVRLELLQPSLRSQVAERVDSPLGKGNPGDREPELTAANLDRNCCRRTRAFSRSARDGHAFRERLPAGNHFLDGAAEYRRGRNAGDRLSGWIPELNRSLRVDEEDAVGDVAEDPGSLPSLLGFPIQPVALFSQTDPFQCVPHAPHDRLEQGDLRLVEGLVIEACHADDAAIDLAGEWHENELLDSDREQVARGHLRLLTGQHVRAAVVVEQLRPLVRR